MKESSSEVEDSFLQKKNYSVGEKYNLVVDKKLFYIWFYLLENPYVFTVKDLWELINWRNSSLDVLFLTFGS